ncbi:MAG: heavy metal translocating P-type ATPase [Streptosporangiaceae bacterium]
MTGVSVLAQSAIGIGVLGGIGLLYLVFGRHERGAGPAGGAATAHEDTRTVVLDLRGLYWASQGPVASSALGRRAGVLHVVVNPVAQSATVVFDPGVTSVAELRAWARECGYHCAGQLVPSHLCDPAEEPTGARLPASGHGGSEQAMHTASGPMQHAGHGGADEHERHAAGDEGVRSPHEVMGHGGHAGMSMAGMARDMRNRFLIAVVLAVPILVWSPIGHDVFGLDVAVPFGLREDVWALLLSLPVVLYADTIFFDGALRALRARTLDMMVLVAVAVGTGWLYSLVITLTGGGDVFYEAVTVLSAFVLLGHWFEMRARGGANTAIHALLDLAPPKAVVLRDGQELEVATSEIVVGDLMLVRPGSKIAVDGVVEEGESEVDESTVTGESMPVHKVPGSDVIGATMNINGTIRVRATKVGADTALAQIVKLVQEAQNSKAPGQRLADRAAFWLVLVALAGGGLTFAVWMLTGSTLATAMLFAITVVVVTCPDALGLATPTAIMIGVGLGAKRGILFKNAMALETSARIQVVVMDKTGTLTKGEPEVTDLITEGLTEAELLHLAAAVERESEHPLAAAIVRRHDDSGASAARAEEFENIPGHGAIAQVDGHHVAVGNLRLMQRQGADLGSLSSRREEMAASGRTAVLVAVDGVAVGLIGVADALRETSLPAIRALQDAGVEVVMLTGDNQATAQRIGQILGIDTVIAEVLPGDKAAKIAELQAQGRKVAMVGDGVNDAPALALADLGIAIGAGTDVAIETADVVLMRSDPLDVVAALRIGRGTLRKMRQNLAWAVGYNVIALPIAAGVFEPAFGFVLRPEIAALSMSGSSVIVAVNALMLKRLHLPQAPAPAEIASTDRLAPAESASHR